MQVQSTTRDASLSDPLGNDDGLESHELESLGFSSSGKPIDDTSSGQHWIRFVLNENGNCEGLRCRAYFLDGSTEERRLRRAQQGVF